MAAGIPWKRNLPDDNAINSWVQGAMMNMARLPFSTHLRKPINP